MRILAFGTLLSFLLVPVYAGTLRLGAPVVSNNQYRFPVYLQGDAEDVAALDFRLSYDPAVFNPVSAQSGPSAASAQKQVSSNLTAPGEFVVVMMGFNQNAVAAGQVVEIVLEKVSDPADGRSVLRIDEPTLATADGSPIRSRGLARTVAFDQNKGEGETDNSEESGRDSTEQEGPEETSGGGGEGGETVAPRTPSGSVPFIIAGRNTDGTAVSGRMPVTAGAQPGTGGQVHSPGANRGAATTDGRANHSSSAADAGPVTRGSGPVAPDTARAGSTAQPAGEVRTAPIDVSLPGEPASAMGVEQHGSAESAALSDGDSNERQRFFSILLVLGLAPAGVFVVYKVLLR